jgi:hypothetical protein
VCRVFEDGSVVDQAFQARLSEGVVRSYMAGGRCAGFGFQKVKALVEAPAARRAETGTRHYTSNADPRFQRLRRLMEDEWTPQLMSLLKIPQRNLPMIRNADCMLGPAGADGSDSYVLGEINVSSFFPAPMRRRRRSRAELLATCGRSDWSKQSTLQTALRHRDRESRASSNAIIVGCSCVAPSP